MKQAQLFIQTYKEVPNDAQVPSHQLLHRAGFIQKSGAGLYHYSHLMVRVIQKAEAIIRKQLNKAGCIEVSLSMVTPSDGWKESGRWDEMGDIMLQFSDRLDRDLCLSPTNEEAIVTYFRNVAKSYKQLPVCLYQINTKFRDEIRPRFGLMRAREFSMKDAYSFHVTQDSLDDTYNTMYQAYNAIFNAIGLEFIVVQADGGLMADADAKTHEFQVLANTGEDTLVITEDKKQASNVEMARTIRKKPELAYSENTPELIDTPAIKRIDELSHFLSIPETHCLKAVLYKVSDPKDTQWVMACCLGDDDINEITISKALQGKAVTPATEADFKQLNIPAGFIGPVASSIPDCLILIDNQLDDSASYVTGANQVDKHLKHVQLKRDIQTYKKGHLRQAKEGDVTEDGQAIQFKKGIEVGHIFQLGDKYTKTLSALVLNEQGKTVAPVMGCYGIGVGRTVAAAVEQCHDDYGIVWPEAIAPYQLHLLLLNPKESETKKACDELYQRCLNENIEVLYDDRQCSPGIKFKDADLIGIPTQVIMGKHFLNEQKLEIIDRKTRQKESVAYKEALASLIKRRRESHES